MCVISPSAKILPILRGPRVVSGEQGRLVEMLFTLTYANVHLWHPAGQSSLLWSLIGLEDVITIIDQTRLRLEGRAGVGGCRIPFLFLG